jgi:uncharacterized membrane protein (UPF0127 family)
MRFSIDILFCDRNKKIISLFFNVPPGRLICPWRYFFGGSRFAIEFSDAEVRDLKIGDELDWDEA